MEFFHFEFAIKEINISLQSSEKQDVDIKIIKTGGLSQQQNLLEIKLPQIARKFPLISSENLINGSIHLSQIKSSI